MRAAKVLIYWSNKLERWLWLIAFLKAVLKHNKMKIESAASWYLLHIPSAILQRALSIRKTKPIPRGIAKERRKIPICVVIVSSARIAGMLTETNFEKRLLKVPSIGDPNRTMIVFISTKMLFAHYRRAYKHGWRARCVNTMILKQNNTILAKPGKNMGEHTGI